MEIRAMTFLKQIPTFGRSSVVRSAKSPKVGLSVERLESRELMAVTAWTSSGALVINADPLGGQVDVQSVGSTLQVTGQGTALAFSVIGITSMTFNGSSRDDSFTNHTALTATV